MTDSLDKFESYNSTKESKDKVVSIEETYKANWRKQYKLKSYLTIIYLISHLFDIHEVTRDFPSVPQRN
jgi:hypothetical protein